MFNSKISHAFFAIFWIFCCLKANLCAQAPTTPSDQAPSPSQQTEPKKQENSDDSSEHRPQEKHLSKLAQTKAGESEENNKKPNSPHKLTGTVAFLTDYRSRGISQSFRRPAAQGELKYTHVSGFYFKCWGSNVDGTTHFFNNTSLEMDFYLGFKHRLFCTPFEYDTGLLYYYYPGGHAHVPANTSYDTLEYYVAWIYNKFEIRLSIALNDFFAINSSNPPRNWDKNKDLRPNGHSYGSPYLEMNYEIAFYPKWKAAFHLGYQNIIHYPQLNYVDWLASLTREFEWFEVTLTYVQTNAKKAFTRVPDHSFRRRRVDLGGPGVVAAIVKTF